MSESEQGGQRVLLVELGGGPPAPRRARALSRTEDGYEVLVDGPPLDPDRAYILDTGRLEDDLVEVRVVEVLGRRARLGVERAWPRDRREFPRVDLVLGFFWRGLPGFPGAEACQQWSQRGTLPEGAGPERRPRPLVNLSASGLSFEEEKPPVEGGTVLLCLEVPGRSPGLRCAARVTRVRALTETEREAHPAASPDARHVAVELVEADATIRQALLDLVVERQGPT